jgi:hypothetical protein
MGGYCYRKHLFHLGRKTIEGKERERVRQVPGGLASQSVAYDTVDNNN